MKDKLRIYLSSGEHIDIKCKNWKFNYDNETLKYVGYEINGSRKKFGLVPSEIVAFKVL